MIYYSIRKVSCKTLLHNFCRKDIQMNRRQYIKYGVSSTIMELNMKFFFFFGEKCLSFLNFLKQAGIL